MPYAKEFLKSAYKLLRTSCASIVPIVQVMRGFQAGLKGVTNIKRFLIIPTYKDEVGPVVKYFWIRILAPIWVRIRGYSHSYH